jgi:hypothetical protein
MDKKEFVKDGLTTDEIREKVKQFRIYLANPNNMSYEEKIKYLEFSEPFFLERYPMLFDMATRNDFDYNSLNYFLNMRDKIINDQISFENASKEVGQTWFNKHVDSSKFKK